MPAGPTSLPQQARGRRVPRPFALPSRRAWLCSPPQTWGGGLGARRGCEHNSPHLGTHAVALLIIFCCDVAPHPPVALSHPTRGGLLTVIEIAAGSSQAFHVRCSPPS